MAYTRGRCSNFDYCIVADSRRDVDVPVGQDFVCPQCGKPLRAPPMRNDGTGLAVAAMIGFGAIILVSGAMYLGLRLGERARMQAAAAITPPTQTSAPPAVVRPAAPAASADPVLSSSPHSDAVLIRIAGSAEMAERLVPALAAAFLAQNGDAEVDSKPGPGGELRIVGTRAGNHEAIVVTAGSATDGFRALAGGGADMVLSARPILQGERDALASVAATSPASEQVVALGALAVVVNQANKLAVLRIDQLRGVFGGATRDWSEIGGGSGAIHVYVEKSASELRDKFALLAQAGDDFAADATIEADAAAVAAAVAADPHGIGVVDLPHVTGVRAVPIADAGGAPVAPSNSLAVALGDYPLGYRLYFYTPGSATDPILRHFMAFALSPDGQALLAPIGLVSPFLMPPTQPLPPVAPADVRRFVGNARRLPVAFHFDPNGRDLDADDARAMDRLAFLLQSNHVTGDRLVVAGFSDNHQRPSVGLASARARADALAMVLARYGLAPARVEGFGAQFPVTDNNTEEGRARNRRVEVFLMP